MTIKQLRYIISVADNQFNISAAAEKLYTSQPGISKQIRLLEEELGCEIFIRNGKALQGLSEKGEAVIKQARIILTEYNNLLRMVSGKHNRERFVLATTATQSHYILPPIVQQFHTLFPQIAMNIHDGNMDQLIDIAKNREADCIILSGINARLDRAWFPGMVFLPCYEWYQTVVFTHDHPLAKQLARGQALTMDEICAYPIVTYPESKRIRSAIIEQLEIRGLGHHLVATSNDPKVIKSYIRAGLGIGVLSPMAFDKREDHDLQSVSLKGLLPICATIVATEPHQLLKPHVYRFIKLFAPHLDKDDIEKAIQNQQALDQKQTQTINSWVI